MLTEGRYELWVHDFSNQGRFPRPTTLRVQLDNQTIELQPPNDLGCAWHALDFDGASRAVTIVNAIHPDLPFS